MHTHTHHQQFDTISVSISIQVTTMYKTAEDDTFAWCARKLDEQKSHKSRVQQTFPEPYTKLVRAIKKLLIYLKSRK